MPKKIKLDFPNVFDLPEDILIHSIYPFFNIHVRDTEIDTIKKSIKTFYCGFSPEVRKSRTEIMRLEWVLENEIEQLEYLHSIQIQELTHKNTDQSIIYVIKKNHERELKDLEDKHKQNMKIEQDKIDKHKLLNKYIFRAFNATIMFTKVGPSKCFIPSVLKVVTVYGNPDSTINYDIFYASTDLKAITLKITRGLDDTCIRNSKNLEHLYIVDENDRFTNPYFGELAHLKKLTMTNVSKIRKEAIPPQLDYLNVDNCSFSMFGSTFEWLISLDELHLKKVAGLNDMSLNNLYNMKSLYIEDVKSFEILDIHTLVNLKIFSVKMCKKLSTIIFCDNLKLDEVYIYGCIRMKGIMNLIDSTTIHIDSKLFVSKYINKCKEITIEKHIKHEITDDDFRNYVELIYLRVSNMKQLEYPFKFMRNLIDLMIDGCTSIKKNELRMMTNLKLLSVDRCTQLDDDSFKLMTNLTRIWVSGCTQLVNPFVGLKNLESICANRCTSLCDFAFKDLINLKSLYISKCTQLRNPFVGLENLRHLYASGCTGLSDMSLQDLCTFDDTYSLYPYSKMLTLNISRCNNLASPFWGFRLLTKLTARHCSLEKCAFQWLTNIKELDISYDMNLSSYDINDFKDLDNLNILYARIRVIYKIYELIPSLHTYKRNVKDSVLYDDNRRLYDADESSSDDD